MSVITRPVADTGHLRHVFAAHPSGVTALAALIDGRPEGMAASTFTSVSLEPALVSVCLAHSSTTWPTLRLATHLGISVLSAAQQHAGQALAARGTDRFANLAWRATARGAVFLDGASAWLETTVEDTVRAGDHDIVILAVHDLDRDESQAPLIFHGSGFHRLAS
ncbi:flavin reductase family protein [Flexivirga oryzae]|uniref:Flavin reductase (DIM6/NTAB) family NADH-FMN oxidoreductase RutF n=1 Tax=Flexivirga oryzae TaxID=1794944 RepID=A0A839N982_9MICO|nr:flavin reductase family protein [Flexivirga oryzae]MBB2894338.1 flavin reductase (DIM6/NTAB) family NADH-FMN oxidoreductase RutF [Flexivirga oryzae]